MVANAFAKDHIPTFVVGIAIEDATSPTLMNGEPDDTNAFERLNALAVEGGRSRVDPVASF